MITFPIRTLVVLAMLVLYAISFPIVACLFILDALALFVTLAQVEPVLGEDYLAWLKRAIRRMSSFEQSLRPKEKS